MTDSKKEKMSDAKNRILLCALSDPLRDEKSTEMVFDLFEGTGIEVELARSTFEDMTPREKAEEFNQALRAQRYSWIFDLSGGDLANLVLPYIDYEAYANSETYYAAFSDGTCIVNALAACSSKKAALFGLWQQSKAKRVMELIEKGHLEPEIVPLTQEKLPRRAKIFGGNIRCLLKLAGTGRMPDMSGGYLVLESMSAGAFRFSSMAAQLDQCGLFKNIRGVILGRFNRLERECGSRNQALGYMMNILEGYVSEETAFYEAPRLGHLENGEGIWISPTVPMGSREETAALRQATVEPDAKTAENKETGIEDLLASLSEKKDQQEDPNQKESVIDPDEAEESLRRQALAIMGLYAHARANKTPVLRPYGPIVRPAPETENTERTDHSEKTDSENTDPESAAKESAAPAQDESAQNGKAGN